MLNLFTLATLDFTFSLLESLIILIIQVSVDLLTKTIFQQNGNGIVPFERTKIKASGVQSGWVFTVDRGSVCRREGIKERKLLIWRVAYSGLFI